MRHAKSLFPLRFCLGAALLAFCTLGSDADELEIEGVKVPKEITCGDSSLVLNGTAVRYFLKIVEVYVAALYLTEESRDQDHIMNRDRLGKRVHITMLRGVTSEKFEKTIQKNVDTNFSADEKRQFANELKTFFACFGDGGELQKGSVINIDFIPEQGTLVTVDGSAYDAIPGADFYHAILRLWIGKPPQPSMKDGLLGSAN